MAGLCPARRPRGPRWPRAVRSFRIYALLLCPGDLLPGRRRLRQDVSRFEAQRKANLEQVQEALLRVPEQVPVARGQLAWRADWAGLYGLLLFDYPTIGERGAADLSAVEPETETFIGIENVGWDESSSPTTASVGLEDSSHPTLDIPW